MLELWCTPPARAGAARTTGMGADVAPCSLDSARVVASLQPVPCFPGGEFVTCRAGGCGCRPAGAPLRVSHQRVRRRVVVCAGRTLSASLRDVCFAALWLSVSWPLAALCSCWLRVPACACSHAHAGPWRAGLSAVAGSCPAVLRGSVFARLACALGLPLRTACSCPLLRVLGPLGTPAAFELFQTWDSARSLVWQPPPGAALGLADAR